MFIFYLQVDIVRVALVVSAKLSCKSCTALVLNFHDPNTARGRVTGFQIDPVHYCKSNPGSCQHVPAPILAMVSCCGLNQCCSKVLHRNKYITFAKFCVLSLWPIKAEESYPNMYQVGNSMTIPAVANWWLELSCVRC